MSEDHEHILSIVSRNDDITGPTNWVIMVFPDGAGSDPSMRVYEVQLTVYDTPGDSLTTQPRKKRSLRLAANTSRFMLGHLAEALFSDILDPPGGAHGSGTEP